MEGEGREWDGDEKGMVRGRDGGEGMGGGGGWWRGCNMTHCGVVGEVPLDSHVINHKSNRPFPHVIVQMAYCLRRIRFK